MQLNLIYNIILLALFINCLNEMFTLTEVSKVSDAVNISRRLLRSNPKNGARFFLQFFVQSNYAKQRVSFVERGPFCSEESKIISPRQISSIAKNKLHSTYY